MDRSAYLIEALAREHTYRPIGGKVLLSGRTAIDLPAATMPDFLAGPGVKVEDYSRYVAGQAAADRGDVSGHLKDSVDFIIAGGSLEDSFDPALIVRMYADLLRPGGRLLLINPFSHDDNPYVMPSPLWYLDYFVMNRFADCKVYVLVELQPKWVNVFCLDPERLMSAPEAVRNFAAPFPMQVVIFAEKGNASTASASPTQGQYRSQADWAAYRETLSEIARSARPHVVRSTKSLRFFQAVGGHLFVDQDYVAHDPATQERLERGTPLRPERPTLLQHCKYLILWLMKRSGYDVAKTVKDK